MSEDSKKRIVYKQSMYMVVSLVPEVQDLLSLLGQRTDKFLNLQKLHSNPPGPTHFHSSRLERLSLYLLPKTIVSSSNVIRRTCT